LAIAQELVKAGHQLLLVARDARRLERAAHAIRETSAAEVHHLTCDLPSLDDIEKLHPSCVAAGFVPRIRSFAAGTVVG
jgi:short-subunit dehydrogenase